MVTRPLTFTGVRAEALMPPFNLAVSDKATRSGFFNRSLLHIKDVTS